MSTANELLPAPADQPLPQMSPEQLRSDLDTIRSVLSESAASREPHRAIIAGANLVCGFLILLAVPPLLIAFGIPALVAPAHAGDAGSAVVVTLGILGVSCLAILLALATPFLLAGWGLFKNRSWGPVAAVVAAVLNVFNVPLGTALAVYTFWALANGKLKPDGRSR